MSGGAIVPPDLVARMQDAFDCRFTIIYGQTKTSPGIAQTRTDDGWTERTETIGQPYPHTEVSIRDGANHRVVAIGAVGEICVRGYCNMLGCNDNPEATARTIDADGWLHTGDLAAPKTPAHWIVPDAFPLTGSGKIQKFVLRDRYLHGDYAECVLGNAP